MTQITLEEYMLRVQEFYKSEKDFEDFFRKMQNDVQTWNEFRGIPKHLFPKWGGWSILIEHKKKGEKAQNVRDPRLDVLVLNHYNVLYIAQVNQSV